MQCQYEGGLLKWNGYFKQPILWRFYFFVLDWR